MKRAGFLVSVFFLVFIFSFSSMAAFAAPANPAAKPIKIGIIGPMDMRSGNHLFVTAQMAIEKINASGGVKVGAAKRPVELIKYTSNEFKKVSDALSAAERAITVDKVDFLIGGIVPEAVSAMQDIAADNKVIYINTSYSITQKNIERLAKNYNRYKYCFTAASAYNADVAQIHMGIVDVVAKAIRQKGVAKPRIAQMIEKTTGGDLIYAMATKAFKDMGLEITGVWRPSPSASDLRAEAAAIKSSNPNIIYTVFSGPGGIVFGKQLQDLKIPAIVAGSPASSLFLDQGIPYSVVMMSPMSVPTKISDKNAAFYTEFTKRSGGEVSVGSSYDVITDLLHCIEKAGSLNTDALIKAMETEEVYGVGGPVKFDPKDHRIVYLKGYRGLYGIQVMPQGKTAVVWPGNAAAKAQPVQIPQWMVDAWKK